MSEPTAVKSLITPQDQTLRTVFNSQRSYYIDIYQREYKWDEGNVRTLLNDIEVRFLQHDQRKTQPKEIQEDVLERFEPYFLNTYLTSTTAAETSIVDGQQRLTTLLLILIKLLRVLRTVETDPASRGKTFNSKVVEQLIFETNDFGGAERFKIFNANREAAFHALVNTGKLSPDEQTDQTRTRMGKNFETISQYFDQFLKGATPDTFDLPKATYYLTYLLDRVSIVEIRIERQDNVAMIFEVVNDRGRGLQPYEILKGKLIGNLPLAQKEKANAVWTDLQERYFAVQLRNTTETKLDLDSFFRTFFRAKFTGTKDEYEKFESGYHYEMYRNEAVRAYFGNFQDRDLLFRRITEDIHYFAELYLELRTSYDCEPLIFNKLLDQNQQYLLIMSAMRRGDPERSAKIAGIAAKFDQFHTVLRLLNAYDSNEFQRLIYPLNKEVRELPLSEVKPIFDRLLIETLVEQGVLSAGQCADVSDIFEFERFKEVRNQATNFSKYILMRIDRYLAALLDKPSYARDGLVGLEDRFNKNNLKRHGMHLEHILTVHPLNRAQFANPEQIVDEAAFTRTRNLLGMVLLLKDKQNLSSNNEIYVGKQKTYAQSNLIWNELLAGHLPSVDVKRLPAELQVAPVIPTTEGVFPLNQVEQRQRTLFEAIRLVWAKV